MIERAAKNTLTAVDELGAVLVANRGEVALRIYRACHELGLEAVAVHSDADRDAPWLTHADRRLHIGGAAPRDSYLHVGRLLEAAVEADAGAVHPGYGFLAENAEFAAAVSAAGLVWVGPSPDVIATMGDKVAARGLAASVGCPVIAGLTSTDDVAAVADFGLEHGYPLLVKAAHGGGGRGMRMVHGPDELEASLAAARREASAAFGRGDVYVERCLARPRHVEVQVLADRHGHVLAVGDRDCSTQRRHQKLIEEAPAPGLHDGLRQAIADAAVAISRKVGYQGAGTCEFLVEGDDFRFLEMNTRLQVEHPVTEMVSGVDLVAWQLRLAAGEELSLGPDDVRPRGHAIEVRVNAEDVTQGFLPSTGRIVDWRTPDGPGVRVDAAATSGWSVPHEYDSLLAKLIVVAADRDSARHRMLRALDEFVVDGVPTTLEFHRFAIAHDDFARAAVTTVSVEREWDLSALDNAPIATPEQTNPSVAAPALTEAVQPASGPPEATPLDVVTPMQGTIVKIDVAVGDAVQQGDPIVVIEAMKMENALYAHRAGVVVALNVATGDVVDAGTPVVTIGDA